MLRRTAAGLCRRTAPVGPAKVGDLHAQAGLLPVGLEALDDGGHVTADLAPAARQFCETVNHTTVLAPTKLGFGGSEHTLNNTLLHRNPWQASCIELREAAPSGRTRQCQVHSYSHIDFAKLPKRNQSDNGDVNAEEPATGGRPTEEPAEEEEESRLPQLEVVHYFETSTSAGLAAYRAVAQAVRKGHLHGRVENYTAACGYAIWIVPKDEYISMLTERHLLET